MAVPNLAVVGEHGITVHADELRGGPRKEVHVPLRPSARTHEAYASALREAGWAIDGRWGWTDTPTGVSPSVSVTRM